MDNNKFWLPFLDAKLIEQFFKGGVKDHKYVGKMLEYASPITSEEQILILESQIKKYLVSKFEDERIAQVKKTTNWNISIGDDLKRIL